ncbi:MAG: oligosaccharide flippase family protein [Myxococcales bacterium]|nr:oligosaccharide flippase family protein [Myxococcales bacterium]
MAWFTRDVTRTLMAEGPVLLFGLAGSILTARLLGPDARGVYALCFMLAQSAAFVGTLHLGPAMTYVIGRGGLSPARVMGAGLPLAGLLGLLVYGVLSIGEPLLLQAFEALSETTTGRAAVLAAFMLINGVVLEFFRAADDLDRYNVCRMLNPGIRIAALVTAFATGGRLDEALLAVIVGEVACLAIALAILLARTRPVFDGTPAIAVSLLKFGARLEGAAIIGQVDLRIAGFIVAYFAAADQLAFYAIAEGLVFYVVTIPTLVGHVLLPKIAREGAEVAADMTAAACRSTLFVTSGMLLVLGAASQPLLRLLYGEEYLPAAMILVVLLPVALGRSGLRILGRYIIVSNQLYWIGVANTVSLAAHVALLFLWVPTYGVIGAAAATSVSVMLRFAILIEAFRRLSDIGLLEILLVRGTDITRIWRAGLDILSLRALRSSPKGDA